MTLWFKVENFGFYLLKFFTFQIYFANTPYSFSSPHSSLCFLSQTMVFLKPFLKKKKKKLQLDIYENVIKKLASHDSVSHLTSDSKA